MSASTSRRQNLKYHAAIILLGISPYALGILLVSIESLTPVGEIAGFAVGATMVLGVPFILISGLITSLILKRLKKDNRRWNLLGYLIPALLVNLLMLTEIFKSSRWLLGS